MTLEVSVSLAIFNVHTESGGSDKPLPPGFVRNRCVSPYAVRLERRCSHDYSEMHRHARRNIAFWGEASRISSQHLLPWAMTTAVSVQHAIGHAILDFDSVVARHAPSWAILGDALVQSVANLPEIIWKGRHVRIVSATLSCDEDSPVWLARIELADIADFAAIGIGDAISFVLGIETFTLIVDGKALSRASVSEQTLELTAVSPLAMHDAPFHGAIRYYSPAAISAREAVESLLGQSVDWQLPSWIIPAGRLLLENVTPLVAARNIVAAIGGLIESAPDGTAICRRRHPVSIPNYEQAAVAHSLFDFDVISSRAQIAPLRGYNRVTITNVDAEATSSAADRLEYIADEDDAHRGTIRAYPSINRPVTLVHTGHPDTVIEALGKVSRQESALVEFIDGRAATSYPVDAIVGVTWQHADLGSVTADGQEFTAAVVGYSLARIDYVTTSLNWRVMLPVNEEVQFVLMDS